MSDLDSRIQRLLPSQKAWLYSPETERFLMGGWRAGKALCLQTPILTTAGWSTMRELHVGDEVFDEDGRPTRVIFATETMLGHKCYRVVFDDGSEIIADAEHEWNPEIIDNRKVREALKKAGLELKKTYSTEEMSRCVSYNPYRGGSTFAIPVCEPLQNNRITLPIDPYVLGFWLGDGDSASAHITVGESDVAHCTEELNRCGVFSRRIKSSRAARFNLRRPQPFKQKRIYYQLTLGYELRKLGVLDNKHIPSRYLEACVEDRKALLAGLLDSDGHAGKKAIEISTKFPKLAEGIQELLVGLGIKVRCRKNKATLYGKICAPRYRFYFRPEWNAFRLPRKIAAQNLEFRRRNTQVRFIRKIESVQSVPVRCIQVDSPSSLYLAGKSLIPTHNSRVLCTAGLLLSYLIPDNLGFIGRASAKDLQSTTQKTFFDEVCPADMIVGKPKKIGQSGTEVTLKTRYPGYTSKIYFDYIIDKSSGRSHLAGGNWGWFGVDQLEEIARGDWHKLMGRLSRTYYDPTTKTRKAIKTHALGVGNQMGHDWIFEDAYEGGDYVFDLKGQPSVFFKQVKRPHRLGIIVRSEENMMSNGGFVPDDYYVNLRRTMPPHWCARYMDGSFDDFSGKIYGDFNPTSVHVIEPFAIPSHWPWYCAIDPGGSAPWGIVVMRVDEAGNKIVTSSADEIYAKSRLNPNEAVRWVKDNTPIERCRFIIDYQNIPVMQLFQDAGVHCEPAMKDIKVGLDGAMSEFWVNPENTLPAWFEKSQGKARHEDFKEKGSPKIFVFKTCRSFIKEHDNYLWDPEKKNVPKKGQADHVADGTRYLLATNPQAAAGIIHDPYAAFRESDPTSAYHLDGVQRELRRLRMKDAAAAARNSDPDGHVTSEEPTQSFISEFSGGYY